MAYTDKCIHGMNPYWCAICKGLKTPEEEEKDIEKNWTVEDTSDGR